ncbi:MAG TPA: RDD family protein [Candidatus Saccharimonadales bacterium]|jgi:uncharacterized RDD family membrane protein YckC|nr:RDD family protein [Candidatus Saccharimonadales bacterium]
MACPVCGKASPCLHEYARTTIFIDPEVTDDSEQQFALSLDRPAALPRAANAGPQPPLEDEYWRQEVASRVQQHRARRRRRDPNATLALDFASEAPYAVPEVAAGSMQSSPMVASVPQMLAQSATVRPSLVFQARALAAQVEEVQVEEVQAEEVEAALPSATATPSVLMPEPDDPRPEPYKVIQFPRALKQETVAEADGPAETLELAEPVLDTPRILDAPEPEPGHMELMHSFADIELEASHSEEPDDLPPMPAPLAIRFFAGVVDLLVLLAAGLVFASVFLWLASTLPPARLLLPSVMVSGVLLWLVYQYAFLVYSAGTLGMRMAQLELYTFAGEPASMAQRRGRALAAVLSAGSLGVGYLWAYVDEDTLCWHDRITGTCLKEKNHGAM